MRFAIASLLILAAQVAYAGINGSGQQRDEPLGAFNAPRQSRHSLSNPYGAGSRYRSDGLMNPYSRYGSRYSNQSWRNPYATRAPQLYQNNQYRGRWARTATSSIPRRTPTGPTAAGIRPAASTIPTGLAAATRSRSTSGRGGNRRSGVRGAPKVGLGSLLAAGGAHYRTGHW